MIGNLIEKIDEMLLNKTILSTDERTLLFNTKQKLLKMSMDINKIITLWEEYENEKIR